MIKYKPNWNQGRFDYEAGWGLKPVCQKKLNCPFCKKEQFFLFFIATRNSWKRCHQCNNVQPNTTCLDRIAEQESIERK